MSLLSCLKEYHRATSAASVALHLQFPVALSDDRQLYTNKQR